MKNSYEEICKDDQLQIMTKENNTWDKDWCDSPCKGNGPCVRGSQCVGKKDFPQKKYFPIKICNFMEKKFEQSSSEGACRVPKKTF